MGPVAMLVALLKLAEVYKLAVALTLVGMLVVVILLGTSFLYFLCSYKFECNKANTNAIFYDQLPVL
jgi:hypothetical protein